MSAESPPPKRDYALEQPKDVVFIEDLGIVLTPSELVRITRGLDRPARLHIRREEGYIEPISGEGLIVEALMAQNARRHAQARASAGG